MGNDEKLIVVPATFVFIFEAGAGVVVFLHKFEERVDVILVFKLAVLVYKILMILLV